MKDLLYQGCEIKSSPYKVAGNDGCNFTVNGIIQVINRDTLTDILIENLNIPDTEWRHHTEDGADRVFIHYAKLYIDSFGK